MTPLLPAFTAAPEKNQVYNLDLFTLCDALPAASVDMILCDLPYGTTACSWDSIIPFEPMWKAFKRIIRLSGAIVLTASQPFTSALVMSNARMFRHAWVWDKRKGGNIFLANSQPMKSHEDVLIFGTQSPNYYPQLVKRDEIKRSKNYGTGIAIGGDRSPENITYEYTHKYPKSIIEFSNADQTGKQHPTQKPVELFRYLIRTYTEVGQVVFDPCVGSGTTAIAAREEGRSFIVGDSSLEYVEIARARLAAPYTPSFMPQLDLTA